MEQSNLFDAALATRRVAAQAKRWELAEDQELLVAAIEPAAPSSERLAKELLAHFGSYEAVLSAPAEALMEVFGMTYEAAALLKVVHASAIRLLKVEAHKAHALTNWNGVVSYLRAVMGREPIEQVRVLYLDNRNRIIAEEKVSEGTVNHAPAYPREIMRRALMLRATALIVAHNHPSGDPTPSRGDIALTKEIVDAGKTIDIVLHDHVVIGRDREFSFRQEGLI